MEKLNGCGVAFCGGGFKSYAQIAAIEDMEKHGIPIAACAGTSAGALIATLVASGLDAQSIAELLIEADKRIDQEGLLKNMKYRIFGLMTSLGLVSHETMLEQARKTLKDAGINGFKDIKKPLAMPAVDLNTGDLTVFTNEPDLFKDPENNWTCLSGDLDLAYCITASSAYPLAISPVRYLEHYYIDGGCRMNLPTPLFNKNLIDGVVGIGMRRPMRHLDPSEFGTVSILSRTMFCATAQLDAIYSHMADVYVNLPISGVDAFDAGSGAVVIQEARILLASNPVDWSPVVPQPPVVPPASLLEKCKSFFSFK